MPLTKVKLAGLHDGITAYDYINPGLIASVDILDDYYLVVMGNKIEYKIAKDDTTILGLITAADTAYTPP